MLLQTASFHSKFSSILLPPASFRFFCLFFTLVRGGLVCSPPEMNAFWLNAGFLDLPFVVTALTVLFPLAGPPPWRPPGRPFPLDSRSHWSGSGALSVWGSTHWLLCWLHVTHTSSFQAVSGSRFVAAGSHHVPPPSSHSGFSWRWGTTWGWALAAELSWAGCHMAVQGACEWELARGAAAAWPLL